MSGAATSSPKDASFRDAQDGILGNHAKGATVRSLVFGVVASSPVSWGANWSTPP
jgi:hypothetical protein